MEVKIDLGQVYRSRVAVCQSYGMIDLEFIGARR